MNEVRQIYLGTYSRIDSIGHLIKNYFIKCRCWKYCHSPILHAMSLAVIIYYYMYLEVSEGEIEQRWKDKNIVDFCTFHYILSNQMINYNPTHHKYSGDSNIRTAKHQNKSAMENRKVAERVKIVRPSAEEVQLSNFSKNLRSQVSPRCQFTSVWESHTARHAYQVRINSKYSWK